MSQVMVVPPVAVAARGGGSALSNSFGSLHIVCYFRGTISFTSLLSIQVEHFYIYMLSRRHIDPPQKRVHQSFRCVPNLSNASRNSHQPFLEFSNHGEIRICIRKVVPNTPLDRFAQRKPPKLKSSSTSQDVATKFRQGEPCHQPLMLHDSCSLWGKEKKRETDIKSRSSSEVSSTSASSSTAVERSMVTSGEWENMLGLLCHLLSSGDVRSIGQGKVRNRALRW